MSDRTIEFRQLRLQEAARHDSEERRLRRQSSWFGLGRMLLFAAAVWCVVRVFQVGPVWWLKGFLPLAVVFALLVFVHRRVRRAYVRASRRRDLAAESAQRLSGKHGPGASGRFPVPSVSDLDAGRVTVHDEGEKHEISEWALHDLGLDVSTPSLFKLLNTTQSPLGARRLRVILRTPLLEVDAIEERRAGVAELEANKELRDKLMLAFFTARQTSFRRLPAFLAMPRALPGGSFRLLAGIVGVLSMPILVLAIKIPVFLPLLAAILGIGFGLRWRVRSLQQKLRDSYLELEPVLKIALEVAELLQTHDLKSKRLLAHREFFSHYLDRKRGIYLPRLLRYVSFLHLHEIGFLFGIFDFLAQWDLQWLLALEANARPERTRLEELTAASCDLEVILALATFGSEQDHTVAPRLEQASSVRIEIEDGEHPLLEPGRVVANDLRLDQNERLRLITGSNMAGKSTFLRMVALNVVLAQIGCRVRARNMTLVPVKLTANINVEDSLQSGKSYFLVEVERVEEMLRNARQDNRTFGVFDELFRGTNSTERLAASREIARTLAATGGLFLLATHDLELTKLVSEESVEGISVLHFRDEIQNGKMTFPYRAEEGIALTHNALKLLEMSGFPADLVARARAYADRIRPNWESNCGSPETEA